MLPPFRKKKGPQGRLPCASQGHLRSPHRTQMLPCPRLFPQFVSRSVTPLQVTTVAVPQKVRGAPGQPKRLPRILGCRHLHNDGAHYTIEPGETKTRSVQMSGGWAVGWQVIGVPREAAAAWSNQSVHLTLAWPPTRPAQCPWLGCGAGSCGLPLLAFARIAGRQRSPPLLRCPGPARCGACR